MILIYFTECKTLDDVKQLYKTLAKQYHPDKKGGSLEIMQQVNAEYDYVSDRLLKGMNIGQEDREKQTSFSTEYRDRLNLIINLEGVFIELSGTWIWVTGNTKPVKDKLKEAGFFWAKNKNAWFWRPEDQKCFNKNPMSLDEIRSKYGSEKIYHSDRENLLNKASKGG
jgi:curved DNA-binding protein CbpA